MKVEESRFLRYLTDNYNRHLIQSGEAPVLDHLILDALEDRDLLGEQAQSMFSESTNHRFRSRAAHLSSVRKAIRRRWGPALVEFDKCIAAAEELNASYVDNFGSGMANNHKSWFADTRKFGEHDIVGGTALKILLLAALHARACITSTEIGVLLRSGFCEGAQSRARSLYEQAVVIAVLANDGGFQVCERYFDSSKIEKLRYMQAYKLVVNEEKWGPSGDEHLKEAEEEAAWAIARWGTEIREQYGWARPLFPQLPAKQRVQFRHLQEYIDTDLRLLYMYWNRSVHADSLVSIEHADFGTDYLMKTRPKVDAAAMVTTALWTLRLLDNATRDCSRQITHLTQCYDDILIGGELSRLIDEACRLLQRS